MSTKIASIISVRGLAALLTAAMATSCSADEKSALNAPQIHADHFSARDTLRVREDAQRKRHWLLTSGEVLVYDTVGTEKQLLRKIQLPNWSVVGFRNVCMPDITLDRAGSAYVSSNAQARILHIDAQSFRIKDYAIGFDGTRGRDIGFGALAFAADGALLARTTPGAVLWRIDIGRSSAIMIGGNQPPPLDECAITPQLSKDLARSKQP